MSISVTGSCLGGVGSIDIPGFGALPCTGTAEGAVYAWGTIAFSVLGLIFVLLGKKTTSMLAMIFGLLVLVIDGVAIARVNQAIGAVGAIPGLTVSPGIGIILCIVGGLLLMVGGFMAWSAAKKGMMAPPAPMMPAPPGA